MTYREGASLPACEVEPGLFGVKLLDGADGSRQVALVRGWMEPGARHSPHTHDVEEAVVFLGGRGVVEIAGRAYPVGPGDALHIPAGVLHSTLNTGAEDLCFVAAFADNLISADPLQAGGPRSRRPVAAWRVRLAWLLRRAARRLIREA